MWVWIDNHVVFQMKRGHLNCHYGRLCLVTSKRTVATVLLLVSWNSLVMYMIFPISSNHNPLAANLVLLLSLGFNFCKNFAWRNCIHIIQSCVNRTVWEVPSLRAKSASPHCYVAKIQFVFMSLVNSYVYITGQRQLQTPKAMKKLLLLF